ncbi:hepatocyte growth factor-like isoform X2 [Pristis pectinata]|uniref:hepatocyte growth factor-like isoform X2 n=1 Tax=Pristis pectinata TaxID=685728 RepID=UPI00223E39A5|nr:hepatocyte growth factor-like isoform X2 [Pristis pectinata]
MLGTARILLLLCTLILTVDITSAGKNALHDFLKTSGFMLTMSLPHKTQKMNSVEQCAKRCTKYKRFVCRAFYFVTSEKRCHLLSFNSKTKGVKGEQTPRCDLYERKDFIRECIIGKGKNYQGIKSVTESGQTCQYWSSTIPHDHRFLPSNKWNKKLQENYCRNPRGDEGGPWCFTTDPKIRLESCAIPQCSEVECMTCNGEGYRGPMDHTVSGKECQRWDLQKPHSHRFNPERFPDKGLDDNYCRNPNGLAKPWCYTLDPKTPWEYCAIKECVHNCDHDLEVTTECFKGLGESYRGTVNTTPSGIPCQRWDLQTPHRHSFIPEDYKCKDLNKNYCRNPDGAEAPWCFTTHPDIRIAYCFHIPRCEKAAPPSEECYQGTGTAYKGTVAKTRAGVSCAPWESYSQDSERTILYTNPASLVQNYCRNPDADKHGPWCYTNDPHTPWDYCAIEPCNTRVNVPSTDQSPSNSQCLPPKKRLRIVHGFPAKPRIFNWMVSLRHSKPDLRGYEAVMGILKDDKSEEPHKQVIPISQLVCGPEGSNLAMLKLSRPVKFTDYVCKISLPVSECVIQEGVSCNISGWGETKDTGYEGELKAAKIHIIGPKKCNEYHQGRYQINENEICAGDAEGTVGTCERDYGGPLVCEEGGQKLLQGVIIPGRGCARPKRPGIFVRVSHYVSWINKVFRTYGRNNYAQR